MNREQHVAHALLWASAIVASAVSGAPVLFSIGLLPALAAVALFVIPGRVERDMCRP